ncbi:Pentatricopeptide repeat-containing protein [Apostasia shenzhenica]|uniref:Pentatricopeptide repeat-containing protein n=1 Tax=Apostasia shenzhenica TaxID=1088818 RepID=A0A2I0B909_9ASPA|nr:Pentatricopeptide repeat-containing protein [Apostasia shenzhenica]
MAMKRNLRMLSTFKWNSALRGLLEANIPQKAILGFSDMRRKGVRADRYTALFLIKAFNCLFPLISPAEQLHSYIIRLGFESNVIIRTSMIRTYALYGSLHHAHKLFDESLQRDFVMWNSLIAAYEQMGDPREAARVAFSMIHSNVRPNEVTVVSIISSCSQMKALAHGRSVHGYGIKNLLGFDIFVQNALINMYSRCARLSVARRLFDLMSVRNAVSWTTMIGGYTSNNCLIEAFHLFKEMEAAKIIPDEATVLSLVSLCTKMSNSEFRDWIDAYVDENVLRGSKCIANALMDMHSKCGGMQKACEIFDRTRERSTISWAAMIQGLALHGHGTAALTRFVQMQMEGFKPDEILFLNIMNACSHAGMVHEGKQCFKSMAEEYGLIPWIEHYGVMVDLLCRAGLLNEAFEFIACMPIKPDGVIWRTVTRACEEQGNVFIARQLIDLLMKFEPKYSGNYVMKSNLHAVIGQWNDVEVVRSEMCVREVRKNHHACSWIDMNHIIQ